ncbi:Uma2 family endonuclease [Oscillatoria sp. FACHB-1407]|nr:Uma2 family endonuclease [Oscillatoria sp. FACHB-1407]
MVLTAQQLADLMPDATQLESNEPEIESSLHYAQLALLVACLEWLWRDRTDFFIGADLSIYFSRQQLKNRDFRGPDFFLVKKTEKRPRKSWVVWEEDGRYPDLIIELLSSSTADVDRTLKKELYQDRFRTHEYFLFSPENLEFVGYRLVSQRYEAIAPTESGLLWSETLDLYLGCHNGQLRYFTPDGALAPTPEEDALQAQQQALQAQQQALVAQQRAEEAQQRAERLAERLRSLGIEPDGE